MNRIRSRPRILITCWRRPLPTYLGERTVLDTLDPAYAARVSDAGGLPLLLSRPPGTGGGAIYDLLDLADGLVLTGGGDVDPTSYGARPENVADVDEEADAWELALIVAARDRELPTLAICRGAQLLAVAHGGRLAQRMSVSEGHEDLSGLTPDAILSARHAIRVAAGSRVEGALGSEPLAVNTIHHQEISDPGELEVTAITGGGVIEAVEPRVDWPCVGVQWHPEKMAEPEQRGLFEQLVAAARARPTAAPPNAASARKRSGARA